MKLFYHKTSLKCLVFVFFIIIHYVASFAQIDSTAFFEKSKRKWPFPVPGHLNGYVTQKQKIISSHVSHLAIEIDLDRSREVYAVHDGVICGVFEVDSVYYLMVSFGAYFVVYGGLSKPDLYKGQFLNIGQEIGRVILVTSKNRYILEILLLKNIKYLNANEWKGW